MMNKKTIVLGNLEDKDHITFYSEDEKFDFVGKLMMVDVYFDGASKPRFKFSADGWVAGSARTNIIRIAIPRGSYSAKIVMSSMAGLREMDQVVVTAEDQVADEVKKKAS